MSLHLRSELPGRWGTQATRAENWTRALTPSSALALALASHVMSKSVSPSEPQLDKYSSVFKMSLLRLGPVQWLRLMLPTQGCGSDPWLRSQEPTCCMVWPNFFFDDKTSLKTRSTGENLCALESDPEKGFWGRDEDGNR